MLYKKFEGISLQSDVLDGLICYVPSPGPRSSAGAGIFARLSRGGVVRKYRRQHWNEDLVSGAQTSGVEIPSNFL